MWPAIISGGLALAGGIMGGNAARSAARTQSASADRAMQERRQMYDQQRSDLQPWRQSGSQALNRLNAMYGFDGGEGGGQAMLEMDPGYQFRMEQGEKALQNNLLAKGGALSGAGLKAGQRYAQDFGSQEFGKAYNRLFNMSEAGRGATTTTGQFGSGMAQGVGDLMTQQGNVQAAGQIGQANAFGNALNQGMSMYGMMNRGGGGGYGGGMGGLNDWRNIGLGS